MSNAEKPGGNVAVPAGLEQDVDHLAVLVHGAPEVLTPAANRHEEFVQMPGVAHGPGPSRSRRAYARPKVSDQCRMVFLRDGDAALCEDVFDVSEAQGKR